MCADAVRFAQRDRLPQRRHRRVPARPARQLRLHRDEPADPGRAHGDRGGHRRRPGAVADADRRRRDAGRPRPLPGRRPAPRRRAAVPDHHRGPGQRLPPGHRHDHDLPLPRRRAASGSTAARRTPAPRSPRTSTRCWPSSPAAAATFDKAVEKARRAVAEFRIRGVSTNIPFLQAVLDDPDFAAGGVTTSFIETHPQLLLARGTGDRGSKLLSYLADVTVNQPHGAGAGQPRPGQQAARRSNLDVPAPDGTRQLLLEVGPEEFARRLRERTGRRRHRHHVPRRPPVACSPPGSAPATC